MASQGDTDRPIVLEAEPIADEPRGWFAERVDLFTADGYDGVTGHASAADAQGLIVRTACRVDSHLLDHLPRLRVVGRAGVGVEHIDLHACVARGIRVVHTPGANTSAVCELVWAFILDAARPRVFLEQPVDPPRWEQIRRELTADRGLAGRTLGIYGLGRVGSAVARVGAALGLRVIYQDLLDRGGGHAQPVGREQLLAESDILSVHVDGRRENRGLIDADACGRFRHDVVFIDTSRGLVVDRIALAEFMIAHPAATAVLDVHEPEPFGPRDPLIDIVNVHLSPHLGSATRDAKVRMSWVVRDVWRVLSGEEPEHEALPD